ncbi:hypothetical protein WR25_27047 [Diploscapter pachys]|uniref:L-Fucosyltransferase n=1 Tax=Diploscapter pachys TaxID=2018661 RepID=A0A2A2KCM2_9BILA|nr:hypothetical protein WR25_27047 [Diploscapter pachys]
MQQLALFNNTIRSQRFALPLINPSLNSKISFPSLRTRGPLYPTIPPLVKQNHSSKQKFITSPLHAIRLNGGLGNQLFELISLIGIGRNLNRQPIIPADNGVALSILSSSIFPRYPMILDQIQVRFFESYKYFESIRNEVRLWLSPQRMHTLRATMMIPNDVVKRFKICTHIRRGDFVTDGMHLPSDPDFARDATEYLIAKFRKKLKRKAVVVVLGNDPIFSHYIFHDKVAHPADIEHFNVNESLYLPKRIMQYKVILTPTLSPEVDLSFSRNFCDVVLITAPSSTFGFWIAYLAKDGAKVFYRDIEQTLDKKSTRRGNNLASTRSSNKVDRDRDGQRAVDRDRHGKGDRPELGKGKGKKSTRGGKGNGRQGPVVMVIHKKDEEDTLSNDLPEEMPEIVIERSGLADSLEASFSLDVPLPCAAAGFSASSADRAAASG